MPSKFIISGEMQALELIDIDAATICLAS